MKFYTKRCSQNTQKITQQKQEGSLLDFRKFLSFTRNFLFLLSLASLFLLASCGGGGGGSRGAPGSAANLAIADSSANEDAGSINFRVTLRSAADSITSFYYRTKDDSAVAGSDYMAVAKSASIASGDIATTISVDIINDDKIEDEESFFVEILSSSTADTVIARATATIKIDDLPSLSITGAVASEDAESLEFIARLSAAFPGNDVSFSYQTLAGSATQGDDYTGVATKTATIPADSTQISIPISIVNDSIDEGTEVFELVISKPVNATISQASALGIIKGEIASLFIADDSIPENTGVLKFIVILTRVVKQTVYFEYQTLTSSASFLDYTSALGRASIPVGDTTAEISISIIDDQLVEDDEEFFVEISSPTRGILISRERATVTIRIDDLPKLSVADISVAEDVGSLQFIASLSEPFPGHIVAFDYETIPSSASSNLDYTHVARRASIKAGELITSIFIDIIDDLDVENDESFDLVISKPSNATIDENRARATVTIEIDDLPILSIANVSVFENAGILKFVASLSEPFGADVSFDYQTRAGSAIPGFDYTSDFGRASILAGDTTTEIPIAIINDDDIEAAESFDLVISKLVNATISKPSATATIKIDELPILSVTDATALESAGSLQFVASLSEPFPGNIVSFDYETMPSSASRDLDYSHASARATILAGDTTTSILIAITNDTLVEADESFDLVIANPANATIDKNRARATGIIEIDDLPSLSITGSSVAEDAGSLIFVARLSEPFGANVSFDYQTRAGSASSPSDYTSASGRASILVGNTTTEIPITISDDVVNEGDEVFSLELSNPVNATISKASALGIIEGEIASLFIADAAAFESELELRFVVTLSKAVSQNLSFSYSTIAGSATEGDDYTVVAAETTIPAGSTTAEIIIALSDDTDVEDDETFDVEISNVSSTEVLLSKERATGTIKIDDLPTLSIAGASAIESAGSLGFVVSLSEAFPGNEVSFFYSTLGGSAIARLDYTHFFARASIKADSTSITIPISIIDDLLVEADESFDVIIAQPLNATIEANRARATGIIEFDDLPTLSITGSSVIESAGSLKFTVFLSVPIIKDVSFDYQTLSGSASATIDYTSSSGNITIIAGSTTVEIFIDISDDTLVEADETFDLVITNPANATIDKNRVSATATIEIDDVPRLSITGNSVIESAGSIKFLVTLSEPFPGNIVAFDYYTVQGSAIADLDYTRSFASASIKADSTSVSIPISIIDDVLVEADESFDVIIAQPINATISTARATGIIEFQDLPSLSVVGSSVIESEGSLRFRVFLSVPIMKDVTFDYQTLSGSASADYDYTSAFDTTSIPAGSKEISIFIDLIDDALIEDDETFDLVITNPDNATIDKNRARATATIKIDDLPTLSIAGSSVIESAESIKFLVTLSVPFPGNIVSFDYETIEGSAKNIDYTYSFARASIPAGDTTTAIAIVIRNDSLIEDDESFDLVIANPTNANIDKPSATATIKNDDFPSLSITGSSVMESAGSLRFIVRLSVPFLSTDVFFDYKTISGSALAPSDYTSDSGRASIPAGSSTTEIFIDIVNDDVNEGDEVFSLKLSNPVNATISKASALGIIKGEIASLFIADAAAFESELELRFVVTLSNSDSQEGISFSYRTIAGSATQGEDYTGVPLTTVTIPAGATTADIVIPITDDKFVEDDETFDVEISTQNTEVRFSKKRATGTIKIEDLPILSIANVTTLENAGSLQFIASLSEPFPGHLVSFDYKTLDGSASAGLDYSYLLTTANIYSGDTTAFINIIILDDDLVEDDETFDIIISNLANATIDQLKATATIKIDELPSLSITGSSVVESAGSAKFIVRLSEAFRITDVSFFYQTLAGSATQGDDYTGVPTRRATISAGDSTTAISIDIIDDDTTEDYETFDVIISNPTNATIDENRASATATIQIDELPSLSITGSSVAESAGSAKFIVTLSPPFRITDVLFDYKTSAGSASDDLDYTGVALDTATISAGDSTTAIFIAILDDELVEADESFDVIISNPTNATIDANKARATATIKIDDLPLLSIANVSASEDVGRLEFIAILSEPFDGYEISFNYKTLSGSAIEDNDYEVVALTTVTIPAGATTADIFITILDDDFVEDDETFDIMISNLVNATIDANKTRATATIKIDELPSLSITDAAALENAGSMQFIVTLSRAFSSTEVSFFYQTIVGSASEGDDYTGVDLDTATISAGDSTTAIFIAILDDEFIEDDETFDVVIFNPNNAITGDNRATGTIKIDELPTLSIADATSLESAGSVKFIATLNPPFRNADVSFFFQTLAGSATQGGDYTGVDLGTATISAGESTTAIVIVIDNDIFVEEDESFDVIISNPNNATIDANKARATATIKLEDKPILSIADAKDIESAGSLKFMVTLSAAFSRTDVSFYYKTLAVAGSATEGEDYTGVPLTPVTIYAPDTTTTISIDITSDGIREGDEFFSVRLSKPVNASIENDTAQGTIDGKIPSLSIANATAAENVGQMKFSVTLSKSITSNIGFSYQTKAGSATDGDDYEGVTPTPVTMQVGATTADIFITILNDDDIEDDETFDVIISTDEPADKIAISKKSATGTISIDEQPILSIADVIAPETTKSVKFTATLSKAFLRTDVFFDYKTLGSSASEDLDYEGVALTTVTIPAGATTADIFITITDDMTVEDDETFDVLFSSPVYATLGNTSATARIISDDLPRLFIADATALESEPKMEFIVSLSAAFNIAAVSFEYKTIAGSASDDADYKGVATKSFTIPAGSKEASILIDISNDSLIEDDETFDLVIFSLSNAATGDIRATGTIKIEDLPILSIADVIALESAESVKFTATLSKAFSRTAVSFNFRTVGGSASTTDDYTGVTTQEAHILAGDTTAEIFIDISDDSLVEDDESFDVIISSAVNATIDKNRARATATIINDDLPSLSIADATALESERQMKFIVSLSAAFSSAAVSFEYKTIDTGSASSGDDYKGVALTPVTIPAGATTAEIFIDISDDSLVEDDETFDIIISNPTNATIDANAARATGTIKLEDLPILTITTLDTLEDAGSLVFTGSLSEAFVKTEVSFNYHTEAGTATATDDYTSRSGRFIIPAGERSFIISIRLIDDATIEANETFYLVISSLKKATINETRIEATIKNDDLPILSVADATVDENSRGSFTFSLNTPAKEDVIITWYTRNGTAIEGTDYDAKSNGSTTITAGKTEIDTFVFIKNDDIIEEEDKTFYIEINIHTGGTTQNGTATIGRSRATITIKNNDFPVLSVADSYALEDATSIKFTATLAQPWRSTDVFFNYHTEAGSATATDDYTGVTTTDSRRAMIPAGDTTTEIFIAIINDTTVENDETFDIVISNPDNHDVSIRKFHNRATATIIDDELPLLSIADATALEGAGVIEFRLTLSKPDASLTSYGIRILDVVNGVHTAQQTIDFVLPSTNGSIATGDTSGDLLVTIKQDSIVEGNETFRVELTSISSNAVIYSTRKIAVGTIIDDDEPLTLSIADATALESAGQMKFTLSLNDVLANRDVDVFWSTRAGSALAGDDYTGFTTQKASILAGKTTTDIFIDLKDDSLSELDESFDVIITSSAPGINITKNTATATIVNDDYPTLSITVLEGGERTKHIQFVIFLKDAHKDQVVDVTWRTRDGSALAGVDYTVASGTTFITGTAFNLVSDSFAVDILDDSIHEGSETFDIIITSNFPGINIINNTATATIIDDDLPRLSVADATALEGEDMQFSVILDVTSLENISFSYHTEAGSALAGVDYTEVTANSITTASIPTGSTSASIMISTSSDTVVEGDESFFLVLTDPVNATLDSPRATGTIEGLATIHITGGSALEFNQELRFVARLERPLAEEVSFSYYTLAGSALAGDDYTEVPAAHPLSISIPAGDTATEFSIIITDDDIVEADETFDVRFISPVNAVLGQQQVTATIIDAQPSLSVANAIAQEDAGVIEFIVTLSSSRIKSVSFDYATQSIIANVLKITRDENSIIWNLREHTSVVFNNYMWSLGGSASARRIVKSNVVWHLTSGRDGDFVKDNGFTTDRSSHSSLVFEEKMWVLGGNADNRIYAGNSYQNDVQNSTNGGDWNEVKPNNTTGWQARRSHSSLVFKDKMWVLGGYSKKYLPTDASLRNDVWDSTNGIAWNEVKADSTNDPHSWSARQEHTSVVFDGKMWVLGGSVSGDYNQNDVWDSTNGIAWNEVKTNNSGAGWKARYKHTSVVYEGKIWVLGGDSGKYPARYIEGDAWYSIDGVVWNKNTENFDYRADHTSVVFRDRLWLIGGINNNEVFIKFAYFEAQKDYISKSARVSIPPGATSKTLRINLINDTVAEPTETFRLIISNPTNAVIDPARSKATGTIQDND